MVSSQVDDSIFAIAKTFYASPGADHGVAQSVIGCEMALLIGNEGARLHSGHEHGYMLDVHDVFEACLLLFRSIFERE